MTAPSFLDRARELDMDVRVLDALLERAVADTSVHPKVVARLLRRRAASVSAWAKMWQTKPVTGGRP